MRRIFDFSFRRFITPQVSGIFYGLAVVVIGLFSFVLLFLLFPLSLIVSPAFFIISVVLARIGIESTVSLMRIAENSSLLVELERKRLTESTSAKPHEAPPPASRPAHPTAPNASSSIDGGQTPSTPL
ncbi:DUF4282 domain-containing protein [Hydrogenibacillus schlegelii]|uniref:DUF4282 domain-containing protein n=1 Tax=Hydrogenibacillus schlegelii TaxID=1484 RepID=UPI00235359BD|nr:DUF4282 domain-containing protein [Hydrogenibacillus schlegelii]